MTNSSKLKGKIAEKGYKLTEFADAIGMSRPTFRSRMKGKSQFKVDEIEVICSTLGITPGDVWAYFFTPKVP